MGDKNSCEMCFGHNFKIELDMLVSYNCHSNNSFPLKLTGSTYSASRSSMITVNQVVLLSQQCQHKWHLNHLIYWNL